MMAASRWSAPLSVAPMMDRTDAPFRFLVRQLAPRVRLYTPMIMARAVLEPGGAARLRFDPIERPLGLQLAGTDPTVFAAAARIAVAAGHDEININCGCPSAAAVHGGFGAALMRTPELVARCVAAIRDATDVAVTVKHRLGVDDHAQYEDLERFVDIVAAAGCDGFIVHARAALLGGLRPADNRSIPALRPDLVGRLHQARPRVTVVHNGGIDSVAAVTEALTVTDGAMIGRAAYDDPALVGAAEVAVHGGEPRCRFAAAEAMIGYVERTVAAGRPAAPVLRRMLTLFAGCRGGKAYRRCLTRLAQDASVGGGALGQALRLVRSPGYAQASQASGATNRAGHSPISHFRRAGVQ